MSHFILRPNQCNLAASLDLILSAYLSVDHGTMQLKGEVIQLNPLILEYGGG